MDPLLIDVPEQIETDRLILRSPRAGDGKIVYPSVRESLSELKIWMPWASDEYSEESSEQWCRRAAANFITREQLQFAMLLREDQPHVGNIGRSSSIGMFPRERSDIGCARATTDAA